MAKINYHMIQKFHSKYLSKENENNKSYVHDPMFIASLLTIVKTWK